MYAAAKISTEETNLSGSEIYVGAGVSDFDKLLRNGFKSKKRVRSTFRLKVFTINIPLVCLDDWRIFTVSCVRFDQAVARICPCCVLANQKI
ncbi:hypothetical protein Zmor_021373 [Zophobas morio]|uniref:Uncharacterized protein n=1 Tax=Zophobas morio TaxID=2755281 RepID=A0AA38MAZ0_9CUCU|nr:hypothetical protein Zmor_021373 [Zophobas morio]